MNEETVAFGACKLMVWLFSYGIFFFSLSLFFFAVGWNIFQVLPEIKSLLSCDLIVESGLHQDRTFLHLMKAAYEEIRQLKTT